MAKKANTKKKIDQKADKTVGEPKFPYTNSPGDLRRILQLIPTKPKPPKLTMTVIKTWGIANNNASTALRVLKDIGLIDPTGTPLESYSAYMMPNTGGGVLAQKVRERYSGLFEQHENPQNASNDDLKRFFNINSGGAEQTINFQTNTFKVLSEFCRFDAPYEPENLSGSLSVGSKSSKSSGGAARIHFDLHIHLPEGKSSADYESIIRAISEHIVQKVNS